MVALALIVALLCITIIGIPLALAAHHAGYHPLHGPHLLRQLIAGDAQKELRRWNELKKRKYGPAPAAKDAASRSSQPKCGIWPRRAFTRPARQAACWARSS